MSQSPTAEQLLADAAWLKRLAVTLAGNEADADDLVQEAWIAAWNRKPAADRPMRPWLAKVVRDVAGMKRRSERRRATREQAAIERDAVASPPDALLEQMRLHRLLVDLVLELDEPYRATIIARFVEGCTAAAIARSLRIPESTVRGRFREGLARLRARLDAARGERKAWAPAVLAFVNRGIQVAKPTKSVFLLIALLLLLLGGGLVAVLKIGTRGGTRASKPPTVAIHNAVAAAGHAAPDGTGHLPSWLRGMGDVAHAVSGRVVDEQSKPIAGAVVELQGWTSTLGNAFEGRVTTDGNGTFRFQPRVPWKYTVVAMAPGRTPATAAVDSRKVTTDLVLVLAPCVSTAEGTVTDSGGGTIVGATVTDLRGLSEPLGPSTSTASDGRYSLCLSPGTHRMMFGADGYEHAIRLVEAQGHQRVDVALAIEATVSGRVVDEAGGPIPNVQITLTPWTWESGGPAPRAGLTGDDGRFAIAGVGAGRFAVTASDRDHILPGKQSITVEAGRTADLLLRLVRSVEVSGTVRLDGKPLAAARVAIAFPRVPDTAKTPEFVTADDGSFTVHGVGPTAQARILVPGYDVLSPRLVDTTHGAVANLTVDVVESPKVHGRVIYQSQPVADAEVHIRSSSMQTELRTDAAGQFEAVLAPGTYTLGAESDALGAFSATDVAVTAPTTRTVTIELDADARIFGKVVDAAGAPVVGAEVTAARQQGEDSGVGTTAVDGSFVLYKLAGHGVYKLTVRPFPGAPQILPWAGQAPAPIAMADRRVRTGPLQLVVERAEGEIAGSVVDETDSPVPDALVRLAPWAGLPVAGPAWPLARTDVDGHFQLKTSGPGPFTLEASVGDGPQATKENVPAGAHDVQIQLVRTGEVQGNLVGLAGARVWLQRSGVVSMSGTYIAHVDGDHFRATKLLPGEYVVTALSDSNPGATAAVTVKSAAITSVTLTASDSRTLSGRIVYLGTGAPVAGATCAAAAAAGLSFPPGIAEMARAGVRTATSDATGAFQISDAPAGDAVVFCTQTPEHTTGTALARADGPALVQILRRPEATSDAGIIMDWTVIRARVANVEPQSPAARAGVLPGDVVVSVDGARVDGLGIEVVNDLITGRDPGARVSIGFERNGSEFVRALTTVPFGSLP